MARSGLVVWFLAVLMVTGCRTWDALGRRVQAGIEPPTATPRPTFTPRPTDTPWPTLTPSPTRAPTLIPGMPGIVTGEITATVNVRMGPGMNYPVVGKLRQGTEVKIRGRDFDTQWFFLAQPRHGWVNREYVKYPGDPATLPMVEAPPTPVPPPTLAPSPPPQPTATPMMYVDFRADAPAILLGQCTTLRWDVEGVRAVYLDGQGQFGHGSKEVCPAATRTYALHVVLLGGGYVDRAVTVVVVPATPRP